MGNKELIEKCVEATKLYVIGKGLNLSDKAIHNLIKIYLD